LIAKKFNGLICFLNGKTEKVPLLGHTFEGNIQKNRIEIIHDFSLRFWHGG